MGGLIQGFASALSIQNLFACGAGVIIGTLVGVLPGLGPVATMGLVLPLTFGMTPETGLIMLAGIYYGAMYGGSTTSILMNVPGEAASVVTAIDGYKLALKGKAGTALAVAAIGSFIAGTVGLVGLMLFAPACARFAIGFGPPEYMGIAILGLVTLANLTGKSPLKAFLMVCFGMMIGTVGIDPLLGHERFSLGISKLMGGIELLPLIMGLYGVAEIMRIVETPWVKAQFRNVRFRDLYPSRKDLKRAFPAMGRGSVLGFFVGLIPGPASVLASFVSYVVERRVPKHPEEFGEGAIEGVAGPESANNSACSGTMVPLLALGLSFGPAAAMLMSGFQLHGIRPGPLFIAQYPNVFWTLMASMYIGNVLLLILNLPLVGIFASVMRVPHYILMPITGLIVVIGAYSTVNDMFGVWMMLLAGIIGYVIEKFGFSPAALVVGYVLGPVMEQSLGQALLVSRGSAAYWLSKPVFMTCLICAVLFMVLPPLFNAYRRRTALKVAQGEVAQ